MKAGVIDAAKVTRSALQNAASIAALFLTTEAVVADKPEPEGRRRRHARWHARHGRHGRLLKPIRSQRRLRVGRPSGRPTCASAGAADRATSARTVRPMQSAVGGSHEAAGSTGRGRHRVGRSPRCGGGGGSGRRRATPRCRSQTLQAAASNSQAAESSRVHDGHDRRRRRRAPSTITVDGVTDPATATTRSAGRLDADRSASIEERIVDGVDLHEPAAASRACRRRLPTASGSKLDLEQLEQPSGTFGDLAGPGRVEPSEAGPRVPPGLSGDVEKVGDDTVAAASTHALPRVDRLREGSSTTLPDASADDPRARSPSSGTRPGRRVDRRRGPRRARCTSTMDVGALGGRRRHGRGDDGDSPTSACRSTCRRRPPTRPSTSPTRRLDGPSGSASRPADRTTANGRRTPAGSLTQRGSGRTVASGGVSCTSSTGSIVRGPSADPQAGKRIVDAVQSLGRRRPPGAAVRGARPQGRPRGDGARARSRPPPGSSSRSSRPRRSTSSTPTCRSPSCRSTRAPKTTSGPGSRREEGLDGRRGRGAARRVARAHRRTTRSSASTRSSRSRRRSASTRCRSAAATAANWYALPFEERKQLMAGHAARRSHVRGPGAAAHHRLDRSRRLGVGRHAARRRSRSR